MDGQAGPIKPKISVTKTPAVETHKTHGGSHFKATRTQSRDIGAPDAFRARDNLYDRRHRTACRITGPARIGAVCGVVDAVTRFQTRRPRQRDRESEDHQSHDD